MGSWYGLGRGPCVCLCIVWRGSFIESPSTSSPQGTSSKSETSQVRCRPPLRPVTSQKHMRMPLVPQDVQSVPLAVDMVQPESTPAFKTTMDAILSGPRSRQPGFYEIACSSFISATAIWTSRLPFWVNSSSAGLTSHPGSSALSGQAFVKLWSVLGDPISPCLVSTALVSSYSRSRSSSRSPFRSGGVPLHRLFHAADLGDCSSCVLARGDTGCSPFSFLFFLSCFDLFWFSAVPSLH
ncbi:hypothetical protein OH77DRAFT_102544 [Trametes cingulata]|nr:hypothetical protein OH77DRAFT_102544 [Trametes cingulata]